MDYKELLGDYWKEFRDGIQGEPLCKRLGKLAPNNYEYIILDDSISNKYDCCIEAKTYVFKNQTEQKISVELTIQDQAHQKEIFCRLKKDKIAIETEMETVLEWLEPDGKKQHNYDIVQFKGADPWDKNDWNNQHEWIKKRIEAFTQTFRKRILEIYSDLQQDS